jgi:hypothetical protein
MLVHDAVTAPGKSALVAATNGTYATYAAYEHT